MVEFRIAVDLTLLFPAGLVFSPDFMPNLSAAVQIIADRCEARWKAYAAGAPLPDGQVIHARSGAYGRSIMQRATGNFAAEVFSELPYARSIEEGAPRYDLKKMLNSSLKVRVTASGRRYLIIPFRHSPNPSNVMKDNAMPASVHEWWQDKKPSHVLRRGTLIGADIRAMFEGTTINPPANARINMTRPSGTGALDIRTGMRLEVPLHRYSWGDRLSKSALRSLGASEDETRRMAGMVMFRKPGAKGGASHSRYLTFRTMVEGSRGWIRPAQPGKWPARTTGQIFHPVAEQLFAAAMQQDIARVLPGASVT